MQARLGNVHIQVAIVGLHLAHAGTGMSDAVAVRQVENNTYGRFEVVCAAAVLRIPSTALLHFVDISTSSPTLMLNVLPSRASSM